VDSHADANRARPERSSRVVGGGDCVGRAGERDEEGVALGIDLDARVPRERVTQGAPVLREEIGVCRSVFLEQPRRALDIGEEERDGSRRQLAPAQFSPRSRWPRG
jgi:hypothetical protein